MRDGHSIPSLRSTQLELDDVHVWHVDFAEAPRDLDALATILSEPEHARAKRFVFPHLATHWRYARIALRHILARYTGSAAGELVFGTGPFGKPYLVGPDGEAAALEFNVSGSGDHALVAVARQRAVGIDIEGVHAIDEAHDIVEHQFSARERATYRALAVEQRLLGFFTAWTRKEAFVKAVGHGLSMPLNSFSVTLDPEVRPQLLEIDGDPSKARDWSLTTLAAPDGYVAALAARGRIGALRTFTWRPAEAPAIPRR